MVEPEVPVSVTFAAPSVAVLDAVNVAVTELPVVAVDGLNATVTPLGRPVAAKLTAPVKLVRVMAIVDAPLAPRATESEAGEARNGEVTGGRARDRERHRVVRVSVPEVAVSVTAAAPRVACSTP